MSTSTTIERTFHVKKTSRGKTNLRKGEQPPTVPSGRLPRITRLMALAIHFDELIATG